MDDFGLSLKKNLVHFDLMFVISVQLMFKSTHFIIAFLLVLCVNIIANVCNRIYDYSIMNSNFNYNL